MSTIKSSVISWAIATIALATLVSPVVAPLAHHVALAQITGNWSLALALPPEGLPWSYPQTAVGYYSALAHGKQPLSIFFAVLTVCALISALVIAWRGEIGRGSVLQDSLLGSACVIDSPSQRKRRNDTWNGRNTPKSAGLVLGCENGRYLYESRTPHALTVGRTGAGKSRFVLLETMHLCLAAGCSIVVSDVKGEIYELTASKASSMARTSLIDLERPERGNRFNPLDLIVGAFDQGNASLARDLADRLAADLVPHEERNPFFSNAARGLLSACTLAVAAAEIPRDQKHLASVCAMIEEGTSGEGEDPALPLKSFFKELGSGHIAYSPASEFISSGTGNAAKNVLSTVKVALRPFSNPGIQWMTAASDPPLETTLRERSVIYLHVLGKDNPSNVVLSCLINQMWLTARRVANESGGKLPSPLVLCLDELGNFPRIAALPEICTLGRSYGVRLFGFVQSIGQLNIYNRPGDGGAGRDEILANMGIKVALSLSDRTDRDYFTELLGKRAVTARSESSRRDNLLRSYGTTESERADEVIHSWEWTGRAPASDGAIAIKAGENGAKGREGAFRMPLLDASQTPAKAFFDLGTEEEEASRRSMVHQDLERRADGVDLSIPVWHVDFWAPSETEPTADAVESDEFSAWDGC